MTSRGRSGEEGAAIVWALMLVNLLLLTGLAVAAVASQVVVRQRVAAVADIAALAAAQSRGEPCAQAVATAEANGMAVSSCAPDGSDVIVGVTTPAPAVVSRLLGMLGRSAAPVTASARAGPPAS